MKAIVQNHYGSPDKIELKEIDKPLVRETDVLIRVRAASLNAGDYFSVKGSPWLVRFSVGFPKPKNYILGWDLAGEVEEIGGSVKGFKPDDMVFGYSKGALAEYTCAPENTLALMPTNLTAEEAAAIPTAGLAALHGLRDAGKLQAGQRVLINGAAGGVGTFAIQIAKALGAQVTGVCSTRNVDMVRSLGADHVIDYTKTDFTRSGERYNLILDNVGNRSFPDCRRALTPDGILLPNSGHAGMGYVIKAFVRSLFQKQQAPPFLSIPNHEDLEALKALIEAGKVKPVIDRTYQLSETPKALAYVGEGHARGKVVILM
ncbi:MAG: NAD(P)-dependent alcohol dehydrogenase [Chlorobiales bacterium]|nr:NAD(P)-dependent alcohol dehydrogenase [Chlorobiales bacterium]